MRYVLQGSSAQINNTICYINENLPKIITSELITTYVVRICQLISSFIKVLRKPRLRQVRRWTRPLFQAVSGSTSPLCTEPSRTLVRPLRGERGFTASCILLMASLCHRVSLCLIWASLQLQHARKVLVPEEIQPPCAAVIV